MPNYRFLQLDVFTDRAFCGNPLAVFPEAEGISDDQMAKIAREMNLSETVFVLKPDSDKALRHLRIFTPAREIPFAGHPIVGTWTMLAGEAVAAMAGNGFFTRSGSESCLSMLSSKMDNRCRWS
jgi:trans-2,3-dihydro-3-hydroxyanthranilate isomerase